MSSAQLSPTEVKRRAITGAVVDGLRAGGVRLTGVIGMVVVARLLTPYDLGLVTIGTTIYAFADFLDDGGMGNALLRREEDPTNAELQAVLAFQLLIDVLIVVGIGLATLPLGLMGRVTTLIACALPLGAFRVPASIVYERRLIYRPLAIADLLGTCMFYVWAITTISLGWGVWGLASAYVVRELSVTVLVLVALPEGRFMPVPSWKKVRPLLRFGVQVQAVGLLHLFRDQGVNILVGSIGGVAVLGLWGVAWRIIQLPVSLMSALWRVSTPGMARLVAAKEDVGSTIERVIALVAIGVGVLIVPLAASASAWIHVLMGAQWAGAASAIPTACLAIAFGVPISAALSGYLWAIGNSSAPMRATAMGIPACLLAVAALFPLIGLSGIGIAYVGSALIESLVFVTAARHTTTFRLGSRLAVPVLVATAAAVCGLLVEHAVGSTLAGGVLSAAVSLGLFLGGLTVVHRAYAADALALIARGLRGAVAPPAAV